MLYCIMSAFPRGLAAASARDVDSPAQEVARWLLTVLTTKIRPSKPQVREEYTTSFMHIFYTNKVPRVVLQFYG
jgi:hypothetical protein